MLRIGYAQSGWLSTDAVERDALLHLATRETRVTTYYMNTSQTGSLGPPEHVQPDAGTRDAAKQALHSASAKCASAGHSQELNEIELSAVRLLSGSALDGDVQGCSVAAEAVLQAH